jgi:ParB-like chromosome segregation protein Spo0J
MDYGKTAEECRIVFGCSIGTVKNLTSLLDLDPKVQSAVSSGKIAASIAWKLAPMPAEEQVTELVKLLESGQTGGEETREIIRQKVGKRGKTRPRTIMSKKDIKKFRDECLASTSEAAQAAAAALSCVLGEKEGLAKYRAIVNAADRAVA